MPLEPGQSEDAFIRAALDGVLARVREHGHEPGTVNLTIDVTLLSDEQVELARTTADAHGLAKLALVDDREPRRPNTVSRSQLSPLQLRSLPD